MERLIKALDVVDGFFHALRLAWPGYGGRWLRCLLLLAAATLVAGFAGPALP